MTTTRRPLIAGNWKMNGLGPDTGALALAIAARADAERPPCDIALCPPATLVASLASALAGSTVAVGGQDCHPATKGAHTGNISAEMLADAGCRYVIVGHSERRADHGEDDALVRAKAEAAQRAGLIAIVCLGESGAQRDAGEALPVVEAQLAGSLPPGANAANTVIAYEPVWAIGTGRTPTGAEIAAVHRHLRTRLAIAMDTEADGVRLLYGGSVKPANAAEILALPDVDGALVGGAALNADDFLSICASCP